MSLYVTDEPLPLPHYPRLNLNGTSAEALIDQLLLVSDCLSRALEALTDATPNARDYQTAPAGAYEAARQIHAQRLASLLVMRDEVMAETNYVQDSKAQRT